MFRFMIILLILFFHTNGMAQSLVKVVTFNMQGMKPGTDPETRLQHIIANLEELDPDIIGLQEINELLNGQGNQAVRIADSLSVHFGIPYYVYQQSTHLSWDNQYRESIGIITKHPVEQQGFFQLVTGTFPRKVVWNLVNTPAGTVNFFTTHLDHLSQSIRVQQVQQIKAYITQQNNQYPAQAVILTGDFNDTPNTPTIQQLTHTGTDIYYIETYIEANQGAPGYTVPANAPTSKIDYLFMLNTSLFSLESSTIIMGTPYNGVNYCSDHRGIMTTFSGAIGVDEPTDQGQMDRNFHLLPNYPNPFHGHTTIQFSLEEHGFGTLQIYDLTGRLVRFLTCGNFEAGTHSIIWDGTNDANESVGSGIYICKLQAELALDQVQTKRMILVR